MDAKLTRRSAIQSAGAVFAMPAIQSNILESGPMPFTPKFADLVRNIATVSGTGPVTLGAAVNGFASLAQAVEAGEQFYYAIQGVDKPQEREVGRGTMQADGRVARQPIAGGLTNFTTGAKTIALVAPAEWFAKLDGAMISASSRAELAGRDGPTTARAYLAEPNLAGTFMFDNSDLSAKVAADVRQGIHVAPASDPTGASGAWVRQFTGPVDPGWFGMSPANSGTENSSALTAMFAALRARGVAGYQSRSLERIEFPAGIFNFASTIELTDGAFDIGGAPVNDESGTTLKFPAGVTGLRVHTATTIGAGGTRAAGETSGRSVIRDLRIDGGFSSTEAEAHGIQLRAVAIVKNVIISDFEGDGVYIVTNAVGDGSNANNFLMEAVRVIRCRDGFSIGGADSNNGTLLGCDASANRRWGFNDRSFLGSSYISCHTATNGWVAGAVPTGCTHGGNRYAVKDGQAAAAATNAPAGTAADNDWWLYIGPGGATTGIVPWSNGTQFREGGAYRTNNPNARNLILNCYSEGDQCPSQCVNPTLIISGLHGAQVKGLAGYIRGEFNGLNVNALTSIGTLTASNPVNIFGPQSGAEADSTLYLDSTSSYSNLQFRSWSAGVPSNDALIKGWRNTGLAISAKAATYFGVDLVAGAFAVDATGAYLTMPGGKVGYGDGAGGNVTQTTAKSAAVTLNKPTGYITLHNAPLAAGASVTFTLSNSLIGFRDQVIVTLRGSGTPGAYRVDVAEIAPAGGSCLIRVTNMSGSTLSEAPLLNFMVLKGAQN